MLALKAESELEKNILALKHLLWKLYWHQNTVMIFVTGSQFQLCHHFVTKRRDLRGQGKENVIYI